MDFKEFKNKQFDGPYEVIQVEIEIDGGLIQGILYLPPKSYEKPYDVIIYFHGFPQVLPLTEVIKNHEYLLDKGYALLLFLFRGIKSSKGSLSLTSLTSDGLQIIQFAQLLSEKGLFNKEAIHLLAHDIGGFIGLFVSANTYMINKILLLSPLIDLNRHIHHEDFKKSLHYIQRFLPGQVKGIGDVEAFVEMSKQEINREAFDLKTILKNQQCKEMKVIIGDEDKITPREEIGLLKKLSSVDPKITLIKGMDHDYIDDEELENIKKEIALFF